MKRLKMIRTLILLSCVATMAQAQNDKGTFSIKPMAGVNVSTFSGGIVSDLYHTKAGFTAGIEAEYGINNWLGLSLGLIYSQQGAKVDGSVSGIVTEETGDQYLTKVQYDGKIQADYLNLPLMANFYIPVIHGLALKTGIQMGILVKDRMNAKTIVETIKIRTSGYWDLDETGNYLRMTETNVSLSDICKSIDFGIPIGLSYEYKNVTLDARYYFGLTKLDKTEDPENTRNRCLSITLGYRFHL